MDSIYFSSKHLKDRRYDAPVALICDCGRATSDHTSQERRRCDQEAA